MPRNLRSAAALLLSVLLVVLVVGLTAGCGGTTTTTAAPATTPTTEASPATTASSPTTVATKVYKIGMTQIVSHPALDMAREGIIAGLKSLGFEEGKNLEIDFQNAEGDMAVATSIGQKFANDKKDLVISITTPSSQAVAKANPDRPIVFCLVTDPVAAGLLKNPAAPEANITGVTDFYKIESHLNLIKELLPNAKTIGLLYNAGEANSVALVEKEEKPKAEAMGYKVVSATASSSAEVLAAVQSLVGRVDVISITTDNTIVSGVDAVMKVAGENKIPVITCDESSVSKGGLAAYVQDSISMGTKAGIMAAKILQGTAVSQLPMENDANYGLMINQTAAKALGITFPDAMVKKASKIFP